MLNARTTPMTPELRKAISDVITGVDVPSDDISIGLQALEALAIDIALFGQAYSFKHCAEGPLYLAGEDDTTLQRALSHLTVRARAMVQLAELLEDLGPDEQEAAEAAE